MPRAITSPKSLLCFSVLLIAGLSIPLFFYRLAERDLWSSHEARAAQDAQSILSDAGWGLPRLFDQQADMQKPPLYYWTVAALAAVTNRPVDAWLVRLPAALAGVFGALVLFGLLAWRSRPGAGLIAALVLLTALHYTWLARVARIDMPLTFAVTVTLGAYYLGRQRLLDGRNAVPWFLLAYATTGGAVLLKGPIGLAIPVVVVTAHLFAEGELPRPWLAPAWLRCLGRYGCWWGLPLVAVMTLPWFLWADAATRGQFFQVFFVKHNLERGLGGGSLASHPWWFYGPQFAFDFLPWSLVLPAVLWLALRRGWWHLDAEARFGLIWLAATTVLLSCSHFKRADYLLPAYPGAALFLGCTTERYSQTAGRPRLVRRALAATVLSVVAAWVVFVSLVLPGSEASLEFRRFADEIRRRAPAPQLILFFRAEAHALAFHLGRPVDTIREWENLDAWAGRPEIYHVVMPPETAAEWREHLRAGCLEEVLRNTDLAGGSHSHPLVLMRTRPGRETAAP